MAPVSGACVMGVRNIGLSLRLPAFISISCVRTRMVSLGTLMVMMMIMMNDLSVDNNSALSMTILDA